MTMTLIWALLLGALHALGYPTSYFNGILFAPLLAMGGLFYFVQKNENLKKQLLITLFFCIGHNITGYYWIGGTLHEFGELPLVLSYFLNILFSFFTLMHLWPIIIALYFIKKKIKLLPAALALIITLIEYYAPQQFPTFLGQNALLAAPYLGAAPIGGIALYSFFSYWIIFHILAPNMKNNTKQTGFIIAACLAFLTFNIFTPLKLESNKTLNIRIVQASVQNEDKIASEKGSMNVYNQIIAKYKNLSLSPPRSETEKPELIIWPETAYPFLLSFETMQLSPQTAIPKAIKESIELSKAYHFLGGYDKNLKVKNEEYNSTFLFAPEIFPSAVYHKRNLIPFGETLPFGYFNQFLKPYVSNIAFFTKGEEYTHFQVSTKNAEALSFISPICYEILSPEFIRDYLSAKPGADFIVNLTNDSWYGDTSEPHQHLYLAKWRALEFQKPIVRSTNNGITSVLYPDGSESRRLTYNEVTFLDHELKIGPDISTLYQRWGIIVTMLFGLCLTLISFVIHRKKN